MKAMILILLALLLLGAVPRSADAILMCISQRGDERCHPTDGTEPPADCGYPGFWQGLRTGWQSFQQWAQDHFDRL